MLGKLINLISVCLATDFFKQSTLQKICEKFLEEKLHMWFFSRKKKNKIFFYFIEEKFLSENFFWAGVIRMNYDSHFKCLNFDLETWN